MSRLQSSLIWYFVVAFVSTVGVCWPFQSIANAQVLHASDGEEDDAFGSSLGTFGNSAIVGAVFDEINGNETGSAYYFGNLNGTSGIINELVKLTASDGANGDFFGATGADLHGDSALIGAWADDDDRGSAYFFKGLDNASGTVTEAVKLTASDGAANHVFGVSVSLVGDTALVGASSADQNGVATGSAYYYKNLDKASGTINENVKLTASDGVQGDGFGADVSLSGDSALVGAFADDDNGFTSGSAYYFKNLDDSVGAINENVKLTASDGASGNRFGISVSLSGDSALVGADGNSGSGTIPGSAYFFKNLDKAVGTVNEDVKLTPSDGMPGEFDFFGNEVSLSRGSALVGTAESAYYFSNLDKASGTINEDLKLTAANGTSGDRFGRSVGMSGDRITVGAHRGDGNARDSGVAYSALISNMTTLDEGNVIRRHEALNFESRVDWIIGGSTSNNSLTLSMETSATVDNFSRIIQIGKMAGSNNNELVVEGTVEGKDLFIGSMDFNFGNQLVMEASGELNVDNLYLARENRFLIEGDLSEFSDLLAYLTSTSRPTDLFADNQMGEWVLINGSNASDFLASRFDKSTGFTTIINVVPEPCMATLLSVGLLILLSQSRRRHSDSPTSNFE